MAGWSRNDTGSAGQLTTTVGTESRTPQTVQTDSTQNSSTRSSQTNTSTQTQNTMNMGQKEYEALLSLIANLQNGGTQEQRVQQGRQTQLEQLVQGLLQEYSGGKAISDSEALVAQALRTALEANMPAISKAVEGAGTSASSMQALLSQDLATKSAESAAALGAKQKTDYGNISVQLADILKQNAGMDSGVTDALVNALSIAKGVNTSSVATQTSTQKGQSNTTGTTSSTQTTSGGDILRTGSQLVMPTDSYVNQALPTVANTRANTGVNTALYDSSTASGSKAISAIEDYYNSAYRARGGYISSKDPDTGLETLTEFSPRAY